MSFERRINEQLTTYWESLKTKNGKIPSEQDIDISQLSDIWQDCFLIKVDNHSSQNYTYKFSYLGDHIIEAYSCDFTGLDIETQIAQEIGLALKHNFDKLIKTPEPTTFDLEFENAKGILVKSRSCILPLLGLDNQIDYILGGTKWKNF